MADVSLQIRVNYHLECEEAVNVQIQLQLYAAYMYLSMAVYCYRFDVALPHFRRFFLHQYKRWRQNAGKLMWMQNDRGGRVVFRSISEPQHEDWRSGFHAMKCAFHLEMTMTQSLLELHRLGASKSDCVLCAFLERRFLRDQVLVQRQMGGYVTTLREMGRPGSRRTDYLFDRLTLAEETRDMEQGPPPGPWGPP